MLSATSSLGHLIKQSDLFTKLLVAFLAIGTIICIVSALYVYFLLSYKKKAIDEAVRIFVKEETSDVEIYTISYPYSIVTLLIEKLQKWNYGYHHNIEDFLGILAQEYFIKEICIIRLLGMAAAVSPLLGLLGTVWGVMQAFLGMAQQQGADLAAVAPGIAEALITTLAGLIVAIPALVFYHILHIMISRLDAHISLISAKLISIFIIKNRN